MNIIHIINNLGIGKYAGGAELFSIRLLENLPNYFDRHLIIIWKTNTENEMLIISDLSTDIKVVFLGDYFNKWKTLSRAILTFLSYLKKNKPTIVHSHSELPDIFGLLSKIFYSKSIFFIRTMHTDKQWFNSWILERSLIRFLLPLICDKEIAISKMTKQRLDERWIAKLIFKKSKLIYNGIDEEKILANNKKVANLEIINKNRKIKIISTGRLTEQKGYSYLIEAINIVSNEFDLELYIYGEGNQRNFLQELIDKYSLTDKIKLEGHYNDVWKIYKDFDFFISSSLYEGFPTVILEAMVLNLPIIATDVSGSKELIVNGETGLLVSPKNSQALADSIRFFINNYDEAKKFAEKAQKKAKYYNINNISKEYEMIYRDYFSNRSY